MKKLGTSKLMLSFIMVITIFIVNCSTGPPVIPTYNSPEYSFGANDLSEQTISDVTINVKPLSPSTLYDYPELFQYKKDNVHPKHTQGYTMYYPKDSEGNFYCYTLGNEQFILTAFKVKISNNTPHILGMKDARIYLVVGDEEPIKATVHLGDPSLMKIDEAGNVFPKSGLDSDESVVHWVTYYEQESRKAQTGLPDFLKYPVGFAARVIQGNKHNYKLINDVSKEILPDFSYSGLLIFPSLIDPSATEIKLVFYDITTKTDAAGNAIEKTKFEFPLKFNSIGMYKDPVTQKWIEGTPPVAEAG